MVERPQPLSPAARAGLAVAAVVLLLTVGPALVLAARAGAFGGFRAADWAALGFTLKQALLSALISVALAVPVARALARRRFAGRRLVVALLGAPFLLPVIVAVLGLLAIWGRAGILNAGLAALGLPPVSIYGLDGVVLAHVFFNLPLAARLLLEGWQSVPAEHFRLAAQLGWRDRDIARHIERPMLRQVLPGAFATVFLLCLASFAVVLVLGGGPRATSLELAIFQAVRFDFDLGRAALLALAQLGLCAATALAAIRLARPAGFGAGLGNPATGWYGRTRRARASDVTALSLALLLLLPPLAGVIVDGVRGLAAGLPPGLAMATFRSLAVALASVALVVPAALALAAAALRRSGIEALGYLPLAASPMVLGTGLFLLVHPVANPGDLALALTALVNATMALPFALRAILPALRTAEAEYRPLAASLGMQGWTGFRLAIWPRIRRPVRFTAGLAAALSVGDLGVIALFADPDQATLPMLLYRLMGTYRMAEAQAAALILVALAFGLFLAFDLGGGRDRT
jgi:thiamine transport system permease protein